MLAPAPGWGVTATWADLGCGTGTFTLALAELLGAGSTIHAIDRDAEALASVPATHRDVRILTRQADIEALQLSAASLDGVLLANSLHYVRAQSTLIASITGALIDRSGSCIIVEYDTERPVPRWVPYPVSRRKASTLLRDAGLSDLRRLAERPSAYGRGPLYSLWGRRSMSSGDRDRRSETRFSLATRCAGNLPSAADAS